MRRWLALAVVPAVLLAGVACSSEQGTREEQGDRGGTRDGVAAPRQDPGAGDPGSGTETIERREPDAGVGEPATAGGVSVRVFDVRSEDTVHYVSAPGAEPVTRETPSGEYVVVDYVARNISGSPLTTRARATLHDAGGNTYRQDASIDPPGGGTDGMELGTGRKQASAMFFKVPNGVTPERLELRAPGDRALFDLLLSGTEKIPPEDYLRVYHAYFNQKAYEEAYEMFDPTTVRGITLGDWLEFYEPQWGRRFYGLDTLSDVSLSAEEAIFRMDRTFYDGDGDPLPDADLNVSVEQEMTREGGAWQLVMRDDLISDISGGATISDAPESTSREPIPMLIRPEETTPEETRPPETTTAGSTVAPTTVSGD